MGGGGEGTEECSESHVCILSLEEGSHLLQVPALRNGSECMCANCIIN